VEALRDVTIDIKRGEFLGIIGPNGSGKTSLLKCINGILKPLAGTIYLDGRLIENLNPKEIARICASVPAEIPEHLNITVSDFVFLGRYPYIRGIWWEDKQDEEFVKRVLAYLQLCHLKRRKLSEISSGELQRVLLARAMAQNPKVLLVDEPCAHLDLKYKLEVMELLKALSKNGITIIASSHDVNLLSRYCDRIILLNRGKIAAVGKPEDVITERTIKEVYGIEVLIITDKDGIFVIPRRPLPSFSGNGSD